MSGISRSISAPDKGAPTLEYLESLSGPDALRHKVLAAARIPGDIALHVLGDHVALLDHADRMDLSVCLAAAAKAFAVQLADEAVLIRDSVGDAPDGALRERHVLEAYRRLALHGAVPSAAEWSVPAAALRSTPHDGLTDAGHLDVPDTSTPESR